MKADDLLRLWTIVTSLGLAVLTMLSAVLDWLLLVQTGLVGLMIAVPLGTQRAVARARRPR